MNNIKKLKQPEIPDLGKSIIEVINNYCESEDRKGREVMNAYIVGHLEYVKHGFIKDSME